MRILIIRMSSIGDIVLTTPLLRCIKNQYPHASIHYVCKEKFKNVLASNPYIDKFFYFENDAQPLVLNLLKEKYTHIIDLQNNMRSLFIKTYLRQAYNANIKVGTVNKLNIRKWFKTFFKINFLPDVSIVDRYFKAASHLELKNDSKGLDFFINEDELLKENDLPMSHSAGYIACVIGGSRKTKMLPVEKWKNVISNIDFPIILLGGSDDVENAKQIQELDSIKIYNACGKFSLNESAQIVRDAKLVITNDTGLMHIAAAFKKKIISLWGNTIPEFGMFPYYGFNNLKTTIEPNHVIVENKKLSCRPCSKIGYKSCPKKHFKCMNNLDTAFIVANADKLLKNK